MEGEQYATDGEVEARPPFPPGEEGPPTPRSESALEPSEEGGRQQPALDWYEQDQLEREAERAVVGIVDAVFLRAADRMEAAEVERCELALRRELAAEAAMRRIHDPIVIIDDDDDAPPGIEGQREEAEQAVALECASVEESRRAEDELERYLLNGSDDEPMELRACPAPGSPTPPEACALPVDPPRPQRVWPYEDENWDSDAEMVEPQVRGEQRNVPMEQRRGEAPPRMSRTQRRRARRYNPNRQPTIDDYVSRRPSPPLEEHPGAPSGRERPATPPRPRGERPRQREQRQREDDRAQAGTAPPVRASGVMFGGLRPIPTDPAVDPPPYHCHNCWQHGHDRTQCPRPKVRAYCDNCGRHGADLRDCPRCSEAHRRFVRANFANERSMAEEMERRNREALRQEEERRTAIHREQVRAEQEWRARVEREMGPRHHHHYQTMAVGQIHVHPPPPQHPQVPARPQDALADATRLVDGLRGLPQTAQDVVVQALADSLRRRST